MTPAVEAAFGFAEIPVVSFADLYAGKIRQKYEAEFVGITDDEVTLDGLLATRADLVQAIVGGMPNRRSRKMCRPLLPPSQHTCFLYTAGLDSRSRKQQLTCKLGLTQWMSALAHGRR